MNNVTFGCTKGVLEAMKLLKKRPFSPEALREFHAQAQLNFKPDAEFKTEAIKLHKQLVPALQREVKKVLSEKGFNLLA